MSWRRGAGGGDGAVAKRWVLLLCAGSFSLGLLFTSGMWTLPEATEVAKPNERRGKEAELTAEDCNSAKVGQKQDFRDTLQALDTHNACTGNVWTSPQLRRLQILAILEQNREAGQARSGESHKKDVHLNGREWL